MHRGGAGFSWFEVELDTAAHRGQDWFEVELDTTAPHVTWGQIVGGEQGQPLKIYFDSDEVVRRAFLVSGDRRVEMVAWAEWLTLDVPADWPAGPSAIEVWDALDNRRVYAAVIDFPGVVEPPEPEPVPQPEPYLGGGGWAPDVELRSVSGELAGEVILATLELSLELVTAELPGVVRREVAVHASLDGTVRAERLVLATLDGTREPALLLMQARREDEELLAVLALMT